MSCVKRFRGHFFGKYTDKQTGEKKDVRLLFASINKINSSELNLDRRYIVFGKVSSIKKNICVSGTETFMTCIDLIDKQGEILTVYIFDRDDAEVDVRLNQSVCILNVKIKENIIDADELEGEEVKYYTGGCSHNLISYVTYDDQNSFQSNAQWLTQDPSIQDSLLQVY